MTNCDFLNASHRDGRSEERFSDLDGAGERDYREHVSAHRLTLGEIVVVVIAVVLLAGMGLFNQGTSTQPRSALASVQAESLQSTSSSHCDDDDAYLEKACQP